MKKNKQILKKSSVLLLVIGLFFTVFTYAQSSYTLTGNVTDSSNGLPIIGAAIVIESTNYGSQTDFDGNYSFSANLERKEYILTISSLGYTTKRIKFTAGANTAIVTDITLSEDLLQLNEVVITGSSLVQERKKLGNAITVVKGPEMLKVNPENINTAIQGKIPGAQITQNSGDPAGGFSIRLRGPSTISGSSEPLYVVDGVVVSNLTTNVTNIHFNSLDGQPGQNRMVDINPNDIENISVLNGGAAAAIYGSRASNGVVLITTSKGKSTDGKPDIFFKTSLKMNQLRKKIDINLRGEEFETVPNSTLTGRLWPIFGFNPSDNSLATFRYLSTDKFNTTRYDYQDQIFQTGYGTDNYISAKGGTDKFRYFASAGYLTNEGIIRNTKYNRFSTRLNFNHKVTDWLSYDLGLYYSNGKSDEKPDGNVFYSPINSMNITNNTFDITQRDVNGNLLAVERTRVNPLSIIETFDINQSTSRFIPNLHLKINPVKDLTIDQIIGIDTYNQEGNIDIPIYPYDNVNPSYFNQGYKGNAVAKVFNWNYDINVTYDKDFNDDLNSKTTLGYNFQSSKLEYDATQGRDLDASGNPTVSLQTIPIDSKLEIFGFFLQETVSYKDHLFLTLAGRVDGATNFDPDKRSNFYPKISGSYVVSNAGFWNENNFLNTLKLRASFGESGNLTAITPYERFNRYISTNFLNNNSYQLNSSLGNENLRTEKTKEFEIGTDFSLLNNRLSFMVTYYKQDIKDLIVQRVLAPSLGGATKIDNVGSMENKGLEIYTRVTPVKNNNLVWNLNFNYSRNRNKVLKTDGGSDITIATGSGAPPVIKEGQPLGVFYGTYYARDDNGNLLLTTDGSDGQPVGVPQQERGDLTTGQPQRDANGQPVGDPLKKVIGDPNPDYILGIGTDVTYKNFSFSMLWESVQGFDVFDADKRTRQGVGLGTMAEQELSGELPRGWIAGIYQIQEFRIEDGSFVKLREVSLSYTFDKLFNEKVSDVKIAFTGRNLISFDNFFSYDPETNAGGQSNVLRAVNFGNVPIPRTFALSLSANF